EIVDEIVQPVGKFLYPWRHDHRRISLHPVQPVLEKLSDRLHYFINNLRCEPGLEDWRVRQAEEAARIFETVYKPSIKKAEAEGKAGNPTRGLENPRSVEEGISTVGTRIPPQLPARRQRSEIAPSAQCLGVPHSLVPAGGQRSVDSPSTQRGETALASLIPLRKEAAARQDTSESQGAGMKNSSYELNYERDAKFQELGMVQAKARTYCKCKILENSSCELDLLSSAICPP
ncbi:MAG TPA: hypothetical protein DET40_19165, partial [Lentisphaeria bacterium]|nr:hypothetical protein [Lentisphaeria bacterium]